MFEKELRNSNLFEDISERETQSEITFWKKVLMGVKDAIIFLAKDNLAFRGSSSNIADHNCGNFLNFIKLLSNDYPPLATHLEKLKKHSISYLSDSERIHHHLWETCEVSHTGRNQKIQILFHHD